MYYIYCYILLMCFSWCFAQVVDTVEEAVDYILKKESDS